MKKRAALILFVMSAFVFLGCKKSNETNKVPVIKEKGDGSFKILSFTPEEELPSSVKYPSIQVQFNSPVVPLEKLGEPTDKSDIVTINPPLKGVFRWYGTSLLAFDASDAVIPQKKYTVTINPSLKNTAGKTISGKLEYTFHTEPLYIKSIIPGYSSVLDGNYVDDNNLDMKLATDVAVFFNTPVNDKYITKFLRVETNVVGSDERKTIPYTAKKIQNNDAALRLELKEALAENSEVHIILPEGSSSDAGCIEAGFSEKKFRTLKPFAVSYVDSEVTYLSSKYAKPVVIEFNAPLKDGSEKEFASHVTTDTGVKVSEENVEIRSQYVYIFNLPVDYESHYKLTLDENVTDIYGRKLGTPYTTEVFVPAAASVANFKDYGFKMLEAQFEPKIAFAHQNVLKGSEYTIVPIADVSGKESKKSSLTTAIDLNTTPKNTMVIQTVPLADYLEDVGGSFRGAVQFKSKMNIYYHWYNWRTEEKELKEREVTNEQIIQVTDLGLTTRYAYNKALVMVTKLSTGEPVSGAKVNVFLDSNLMYPPVLLSKKDYEYIGTGVTDESGLAVIELEEGSIRSMGREEAVYVEALTEDDRAVYAPDINNMWRYEIASSRAPRYAERTSRVTFLFTDRGLYKPGEKITFRGVDRKLKLGNYSPFEGGYTVELTDGSWDPKVYGKITGTTSSNGTFWGTFTLPEDITPGSYSIVYRRDGDDRYDREICRVQVQFFERLRFEAHASIPEITYYSGDSLNAEFTANYLGGGSMSGASVESSWTREPVGFAAKSNEFSSYTFGPRRGYEGRSSLSSNESTLSAEGKATSSQKTGGETISGMAYSYSVEANITDAGNQMISARTKTVVHPAKFYIGLSSAKGVKAYPKKGETIRFDYVCLTPDESAPLAKDLPSGDKKKLRIELEREDWKEVQQVGWNGQINTRYVREMVTEEDKSVNLSGSSKPSEIQVTPPKGGAYLLRLTTTDSRGNKIITERYFYVTGSDWYWFNRDEADQITMTTDRDSYAVGETAHILVQSPLPKGTYMLAIEREGILSHRLITLEEPTTVLDVEVEENYVPVMYVTLSSYTNRTEPPSQDFNTPDLGKPKGLFGLCALHVDTSTRRFNISITQNKPSYRPGEEAEVTLHAEQNGVPLANAEITLMAVDRGVVDLINYHVADPVEYFYRENLFPNCTRGGDSRSLLMDPVTYEVKNLVGGDSDESGDKLNERKNFEPTAVFMPSLMTDAEGNVSCKFTLPDTLTAYRITAIGVTKNTFALSEDQMNVAEPVSVRHVLPRKLRLDDLGEVGVTLSNLDGVDHNVDVSLELFDGLEKTGLVQDEEEVTKLPGSAKVVGDAAKSYLAKKSSTGALMFSLKAVKQGWITVQFTVRSDVVNEKIILPLEIEKPYIYETVTTVGDVISEKNKGDAAVEEKIIIPSNADDGKGNIYFQLDSTRLGALHEAVDYVFHYPYGCMEQRSSRVLPLVAFGEYIKVLGMESEVKNPRSIARKEILSWNKVQNKDGGFPYWPDSNLPSSLYVSARIGEIISVAVNKKIISRNDIKNYEGLVNYLVRNASEYAQREEDFFVNYIRAYLYYVISSLGGPVSDSDLNSVVNSKQSELDALSFCGLTYLNKHKNGKAKEVAQKIRRSSKYTARGIDLVSVMGTYTCYSFLNGESENLALALALFSKLDPDDDINQHLVYELLKLQSAGKGYWKSTAITSRVLIALDTYIRAEKLEDSDLSAEVLLGETKVLEGKFKGVSAEPVDVRLDFASEEIAPLPRGKEIPVIFSKKGTGKLFYTLSMKYAIPAEEQKARDEGISIYTEVVDVKTGEVVRDDKLVSGKVYRMKVYVSSTRDREFVAVRAPIPCGAEVMNAAFVTTSGAADNRHNFDEDDYFYAYRDYSFGLSYEQIYDSEVQYFWNMFPAGSQQVDFLFRASRNGTYGTPSATAECMYEPEVFGRSSGKVWKIN